MFELCLRVILSVFFLGIRRVVERRKPERNTLGTYANFFISPKIFPKSLSILFR